MPLSRIFRNGYRNQRLPGIANGTVSRPNVVDRVPDYITYNASLSFTGLEGMGSRSKSGTCSTATRLSRSPLTATRAPAAPGSRSSWTPAGARFTVAAEVKF